MKRHIDDLQAQYRALIIKQAAAKDQAGKDIDEMYRVRGLLQTPASAARILGGGALGAVAGLGIGGLGGELALGKGYGTRMGAVIGATTGGVAGAITAVRRRLRQLKEQGSLQEDDTGMERYIARRNRLAGRGAIIGGALGTLRGGIGGVLTGRDVKEIGALTGVGAIGGALGGAISGAALNRLFKGYRLPTST